MKINRDHMDFSLDSKIRQSLLADIKALHLCSLEDDALFYVNAAGDAAEQKKPEDVHLLDYHEEQ